MAESGAPVAFKNLMRTSVCGGHNLPPLVEIELRSMPKLGGYQSPWHGHMTAGAHIDFLGQKKNRVKGKPCYSRSILVLKPENGTFSFPKSTF